MTRILSSRFALTLLIDLSHLPAPVETPAYFTDMLGLITAVSDAIVYHSSSSEYQIIVILWVEQATAFDGDGVIELSQSKPIVALFVGTLVKNYEGRKGVNRSSACR